MYINNNLKEKFFVYCINDISIPKNKSENHYF